MSDINQAIAKAICKFRLAAKLSQEELADAAEIHRTYVSQIERGLKSPTLHVLFNIAAALNINASDIVQEIEKEMHELQK
jgi:transcriptional regulator with XRE-family HTH domain